MSHQAYHLQPVFRGRKLDADITHIAQSGSCVVVSDSLHRLMVWQLSVSETQIESTVLQQNEWSKITELQCKQAIHMLVVQHVTSSTAVLFAIIGSQLKALLLPSLQTIAYVEISGGRCVASTALVATSTAEIKQGLLAVTDDAQIVIYGYRISSGSNSNIKSPVCDLQQLQRVPIINVLSLLWYSPASNAGIPHPILVATTAHTYFVLSGDSSDVEDSVLPHAAQQPIAVAAGDELWLSFEDCVLTQFDIRKQPQYSNSYSHNGGSNSNAQRDSNSRNSVAAAKANKFISFPNAPTSLSYHSPYILATTTSQQKQQRQLQPLQPQPDELYVMNTHTLTLVQQLSRGVAVNGLYCHTQKSIYYLQPIPLQQQIDQLVQNQMYEQAIAMMRYQQQQKQQLTANDLNEAAATAAAEVELARLYRLSAVQHIREGRYQQAFSDISHSDIRCEEIVPIYANLCQMPESNNIVSSSSSSGDSSNSRSIFSDFKVPIESKSDALSALAAYLHSLRHVHNRSNHNPQQIQQQQQQRPIEQLHKQHARCNSAMLDGVLLCVSLASGQSLSWLKQSNCCDKSQTVTLLQQQQLQLKQHPQLHQALIWYYYSKQLWGEAMHVLQSWCNAEQIKNSSNNNHSGDCNNNKSRDNLHDSAKTAATADRLSFAVSFLLQLNTQLPRSLLFVLLPVCQWLLLHNAEAGTDVFVRGFILNRSSYSSSSSIAAASFCIPIAVAYALVQEHGNLLCRVTFVEALIDESNSGNNKSDSSNDANDDVWHNELALLYLKLQQATTEQQQQQRLTQMQHMPLSTLQQFEACSDCSSNLSSHNSSISNSQQHSANSISSGNKHHSQTLMHFLQRNTRYNAALLLTHFPTICSNNISSSSGKLLLHERAVLLSRMRRHKDVLLLFVHRLHSYSQAEQYCEAVCDSNNNTRSEGNELFLFLLRIYLEKSAADNIAVTNAIVADAAVTTSLSAPTSMSLQLAVSLLTRHGDRFELIAVLNALPENIPLALLQPFLLSKLHLQQQQQQQQHVVKQLYSSKLLSTSVHHLQQQCRSFRAVDELTTCDICNQSIFAFAYTTVVMKPVTESLGRNSSNSGANLLTLSIVHRLCQQQSNNRGGHSSSTAHTSSHK